MTTQKETPNKPVAASSPEVISDQQRTPSGVLGGPEAHLKNLLLERPEQAEEHQAGVSLLGFNIANKGTMTDGNSHFVEGMGDQVIALQNDIYTELHQQAARKVVVQVVKARSETLSFERRPYIIIKTHSGTTAICVVRRGDDAYLAWRTFVIGIWHFKLMLVMLGLALLPNLCAMVFSFGLSIAQGAVGSVADFSPIAVFAPVVIAILVLFWLQIAFAAFAGYVIREGDYLYYLTKDPSLFELEDITASSLAADRAINNALKKAGVADALLRRKASFKVGRKKVSV